MNLQTLGTLRLGREFYERDALDVARDLVGTCLVHVDSEGCLRVARIVETEAYRGPTDAACHARVGLTKRTRALFGPPGHAYVFLIYGMYSCFNAVCLADGQGHAVLVRAAELVYGFAPGIRSDGPGRLTRALGLTRAHDGLDLVGSEALFVSARTGQVSIGVSPRVGVGYAGEIAEEPWRFFDVASPHVSRPSPRLIGLGGKRDLGRGVDATPRERLLAPSRSRPRAQERRGARSRSSDTSPGTRPRDQ